MQQCDFWPRHRKVKLLVTCIACPAGTLGKQLPTYLSISKIQTGNKLQTQRTLTKYEIKHKSTHARAHMHTACMCNTCIRKYESWTAVDRYPWHCLSAHRLPLIYFERTDRTTAEGTFILDRAVCLLDIVDEEWSTDVSNLWQRDCSSYAS